MLFTNQAVQGDQRMNAIKPRNRTWGHSLVFLAACASASLGAAPVGSGDTHAATAMGNPAPPKAYFQSLLQATETTAPGPLHPLLTGETAEPRPLGHNVFLAYLAQSSAQATGVATLHDFLVTDDGAAAVADIGSLAVPRPRQTMVDSLLVDLATALSVMEEEGGEAETFLASRQTDTGAYLKVAQQSRARPELY